MSIIKTEVAPSDSGDVLNGGSSNCELRRNESGLLQIVEHFKWESRTDTGVNIIQEIPANEISGR